jgi:hypothetical protein
VWLEHMEDEIGNVPELPPLHVPPLGSRAGTILITLIIIIIRSLA